MSEGLDGPILWWLGLVLLGVASSALTYLYRVQHDQERAPALLVWLAYIIVFSLLTLAFARL